MTSVRTVTLVMVGADGRVRETRAPFEAAEPWWPEVAGFGPDLQVLRLLHAENPAPHGGHVTYLAQDTEGEAGAGGGANKGSGRSGSGPSGLGQAGSGGAGSGGGALERYPAGAAFAPHPLRAPYAEVGGPAASIGWARGVLGDDVQVHQQRTWNLSAIWRVERGGRTVAWLKQVPAFFGHEAAAIRLVERVAPGVAPPLIADGPQSRMLLAHLGDDDAWGADTALRDRIAAALHPVQVALAGRTLPGIPDGRLPVQRFARVAAPYRDSVPGLAELIDGLPGRLRAIAGCGLPDTLVHGDLHPGNAIVGAEDRVSLMDWGDCVVGHPALDILRLSGPDAADEVVDRWAYRWSRAVPGSEPHRAAELMRPVAELYYAAVYAGFLERIEPAEHPYHAGDVARHLQAAVLR